MIFFDNIIFSLQKVGGISVVWSELLKHVINSHLDYRCLEYNYSSNNILRKVLNISSTRIINKNYFLLCLGRYLNPKLKIRDDESFIFHSSYYRYSINKNAINFTTVHDFTYEYFSSGVKRWFHCSQKYRAILNSDYIICISETTKKDLLKFLPNVDENKIHIIYNGVSNDYYPLKNNIKKHPKYGNFVLFIGSRKGYKNFSLAVEAIKNTNLNLVIVGNKFSKEEIDFLNKKIGPNRFFTLGTISNKELNVIYNEAFCLLYTSAYEGFGIPVLEAQRAGCPVIAFDIPSVVEIIGNTPLIAQLNNIGSIVEKIDMLKDASIRKNIIKNGLVNSAKYSWEKMSNEVISLYKEALNPNYQ